MLQLPKPALRREFLAVRRARSAADLQVARAAIAQHVLQQARAGGWRCVAAYEPLREEPGSPQLLAGLHAAGVQVLVPVTLLDRDLDWAVWTPGRVSRPLAMGAADDTGSGLGPAAVARADAVLVPALAVAADGTRLGRGGGSYDRALTRVGTGVPVAALLFDGELCDVLPVEPWDVPVGAVVTPSGWQELAPRVGRADPD